MASFCIFILRIFSIHNESISLQPPFSEVPQAHPRLSEVVPRFSVEHPLQLLFSAPGLLQLQRVPPLMPQQPHLPSNRKWPRRQLQKLPNQLTPNPPVNPSRFCHQLVVIIKDSLEKYPERLLYGTLLRLEARQLHSQPRHLGLVFKEAGGLRGPGGREGRGVLDPPEELICHPKLLCY